MHWLIGPFYLKRFEHEYRNQNFAKLFERTLLEYQLLFIQSSDSLR